MYAMASSDLKAAKTEDELTAWISAEFNKSGGLQNFMPDVTRQAERSPDGKLIRYRWQAEFPNETVAVFTDFHVDMWGHMYLENVVIGDSELIAANDSEPDSGTGDEPTEDEDTDEDG